MNVYVQGSTFTGYRTIIAITAGETVGLGLTVENGSGCDPVVPVNLTGYSLKAQINFPDGPVLLDTQNGGITITDAVNGMVQVNITSAQSAVFPIGEFPYDLWMVSGGGIETPLLAGNFIVAQNVSPVP